MEKQTSENSGAIVNWKLKGKWLKACNCDPGCPCDFWANPTHTKCEGMIAMDIDEGHFGNTPLNGVKFAASAMWPGPLHEGNGSLHPFIDDKTTQAQRDAILQILSGKAGNMWFEVVSSLVTTVHEPKFLPITFEFDMKKLHARVFVPGYLETIATPIKNKATGQEHRIQVNLPHGMEYKTAETGSTSVNKATGNINFNWPHGHSSFAYIEQTNSGLKS